MHLPQSLPGVGQITSVLLDLSSLYVKLGACYSSVVTKPAGKGEINTQRHTYSHIPIPYHSSWEKTHVKGASRKLDF